MERELIINALNFLDNGNIEKARDLLDELLDKEEYPDELGI